MNEQTLIHVNMSLTVSQLALVAAALASETTSPIMPEVAASQPEAPEAEKPKRGRKAKDETPPPAEEQKGNDPADPAATTPDATPSDASGSSEPDKPLSHEDVLKAAQKVSQNKDRDTLVALLTKFKASKLSEVKEEDRAAFVAEAEQIVG